MSLKNEAIKAAVKSSIKSHVKIPHNGSSSAAKNINISVGCLALSAFILFICGKMHIKVAVSLIVIMVIAIVLPSAGIILSIPVLILVYMINYQSVLKLFDGISAVQKTTSTLTDNINNAASRLTGQNGNANYGGAGNGGAGYGGGGGGNGATGSGGVR